MGLWKSIYGFAGVLKVDLWFSDGSGGRGLGRGGLRFTLLYHVVGETERV